MELCAADDCRKPFKPEPGQEDTQKYCCGECGNRTRVRRYRQRRRVPSGGGPGGGRRQPALFSRSELHRRKAAKSALKPKPKQDGLFPEDGIHATQAIGFAHDGYGNLSDVLVIGRKKRPPSRVLPLPEAPLAA